MRILDTHLHLWDPERFSYPWLEDIPELNQRLAAPEVLAAMAHAEVSPESIFMQADCLASQAIDEVAWVTSEREQLRLRGIIAFAPLEEAGIAEHLDQLAPFDLTVGVRRLLQGEAQGFATSPGFLAGARLVSDRELVFDACVMQHQIGDVIALADAVPQLSIVLDHLGKPHVGSAARPISPEREWRSAMTELARRDNVTCKVSGLPGESQGEWSERQLEPFLDVAVNAFEPERLMFASDWGASFAGDLVEGYGRWLEWVTRWAGSQAPQILAGTGARVYLGED